MDIEFTLINQSTVADVDVVIFQKNMDLSYWEMPIAWKVIRNVKPGAGHLFRFPTENEIAVEDVGGKLSELQSCAPGQLWYIMNDADGGAELRLQGKASVSWREITVLNMLSFGFMNVKLFKDKKLLAAKCNVPPKQKAMFEFRPVLRIAVARGVAEGRSFGSDADLSAGTEISLAGVTKADIILTGNGAPFKFTLRRTA